MAELESKEKIGNVPRNQDRALIPGSMKSYSDISISGSARVHLGDTYCENLTINHLHVMRDTNDAIIHQIGGLQRLAANADHSGPSARKYLKAETLRTNDDIEAYNRRLCDAIAPTQLGDRASAAKRTVSKTKLSFTLIPLGFTYEHVVTREESGEQSVQNKGRPRQRQTLLLRVPVWFAGYQYSIYTNRTSSGWKRFFKVYRDVNDQTNFISHCRMRTASLKVLQQDLRSNPACVYDRFCGLTGLEVYVQAHSSRL